MAVFRSDMIGAIKSFLNLARWLSTMEASFDPNSAIPLPLFDFGPEDSSLKISWFDTALMARS